jgi:hypothetical protein
MTMTVTVIPEHGITPLEAETHHSTAKENKYTPIAGKNRSRRNTTKPKK